MRRDNFTKAPGLQPFDIRSIRHILYEYTPRGMKEFEEMLKVALLASIEQGPREVIAAGEVRPPPNLPR